MSIEFANETYAYSPAFRFVVAMAHLIATGFVFALTKGPQKIAFFECPPYFPSFPILDISWRFVHDQGQPLTGHQYITLSVQKR